MAWLGLSVVLGLALCPLVGLQAAFLAPFGWFLGATFGVVGGAVFARKPFEQLKLSLSITVGAAAGAGFFAGVSLPEGGEGWKTVWPYLIACGGLVVVAPAAVALVFRTDGPQWDRFEP